MPPAIIRDALWEHRRELIERLWALWGNADQAFPQRFRAAAALANYAPSDSRWSVATTGGELAVILVTEPIGMLENWSEYFRPVRDRLQGHLRVSFQLPGRERREQRVAASRILARWFSDEPKVLVDLLLDADPAQFAVLSPSVQRHRREVIRLVERELDGPVPREKEAQQVWAKRQAAGLALLLQSGEAEHVWPTLKHTSSPTVRSYLIQRLGPSGADPQRLANRLREEKDVSVRRALILALGGFTTAGLPRQLRDALKQDLGALYRHDPDAGIHGAAEWLLRQPNDFGLFDLYGNVMEWCHHAADDDWPNPARMARGNTTTRYPADRFRLRGASHRNRLEVTRSARRFQYKPGRMKTYLGFRLARTLPTKSLVVVHRGQPLWGQAEFLVQGPQAPFAIKQLRGGCQVSPTSGTTPCWVRVIAPDSQARPFSFVVERTDAQEAVTVQGLVFSADWDMQFYAWDQANRDELNRPADWAKMLSGPPIAVRKSAHMDFDWGVAAPAHNTPRDYFALVATTEVKLPAGSYELWATADNGARVFVDGIQRIDFNIWLPDEGTSNLANVQLESGVHSFRVEHYESRDHARVRVGLRRLE